LERVEKFQTQRAEVLREAETKKRSILEKHRKADGNIDDARQYMESEIKKRREWSYLKKSD